MGEVSAVQGKASGATISAGTHLLPAGAKKLSLDAQPLSADELRRMDAYWRACNYCCVGMLYLQANPLLREPLKPEHIKNRLLSHWSSDPGQNFTWVHLNRLIKTRGNIHTSMLHRGSKAVGDAQRDHLNQEIEIKCTKQDGLVITRRGQTLIPVDSLYPHFFLIHRDPVLRTAGTERLQPESGVKIGIIDPNRF